MTFSHENVENQHCCGLPDFADHMPRNYLLEEFEHQQQLRLVVLRRQWERRLKTFIRYALAALVILGSIRYGVL